MQQDTVLYIAYSVTSITISGIVALLFWERGKAAGAKYMAVMLCSAMLWGICEFISDLSFNHRVKIIWDNLSFIGVVTIPVMWLAFVTQYAGYTKFLKPKNLHRLFVIPSITLLLLWTNDYHHLMVAERTFSKTSEIVFLSVTYSKWFWIHAAYSYGLFLLGIFLLLKKLVILPQILKRQSLIILAAILVPLVMNMLDTFQVIPSYPIDSTIFSFTIGGIFCFFGLFKYKLFDLIPAARNAVAEVMSGILVVLDDQNHILDINMAARKAFFGDGNDFFGKNLFNLLGAWSSYFMEFEHVMKAEKKVSIETKDGMKYFDLRISPLYDKKDKVIGRIITLYDITALEKAVERSEELRKAAEDANQAKSRFLATMSHEIRTPLNGIIGITELLASANYTEEEKGYLQLVRSCASSLLNIVNDILDFSKIEAGKMVLEETAFSLKDLIEETVKTFLYQTRDKDIRLISNIHPGIPGILAGDPLRVRQVLANLVGNACKFTEKGRIEVKADLIRHENQKAIVKITVKDTGIGIPEEKIDSLFMSFEQVDSSTTRKYGGTGLGLTIAKNLVAMMGGNIEVESRLGEGSSFHATIPFLVPAADISNAASAFGADFHKSDLRILLAEDNKVNQLLIRKLLEKKNIKVDVAGNGKEALLRLEESEYDLILMDVQMPEMDGYEAAQTIRMSEGHTGRHIPIIALTANAAEEDKSACLAAGMDDFLTKPIRTEKLYKCIDKHTGLFKTRASKQAIDRNSQA